MKFKFNEFEKIESIANGELIEGYSNKEIISMIARYNYFVRELDFNTSRQSIKTFVEIVFLDADMNEYASIINSAVKNAKKYPITDVKKVVITKNELDVISALGNIKQEKILFSILAISKYNYELYNGKYGYTSFCKYSELFKMARVSIPIKERPYFMQFATQGGLVEIPNSPSSVAIKPTFIDEDDNNVAIVLGENEFKDLAHTYYAWKEPNKWRKCRLCKCLFKKYKNNDGKDAQVCKDCKDKDIEDIIEIDSYTKILYGQKMRKCKSCESAGVEHWFEVDKRDSQTEMCEECYKKYRKEYVYAKVNEFRGKV